jgi:hypothetical protein
MALNLTAEQLKTNLWCVQTVIDGYGVVPDEALELLAQLRAEVDSPGSSDREYERLRVESCAGRRDRPRTRLICCA